VLSATAQSLERDVIARLSCRPAVTISPDMSVSRQASPASSRRSSRRHSVAPEELLAAASRKSARRQSCLGAETLLAAIAKGADASPKRSFSIPPPETRLRTLENGRRPQLSWLRTGIADDEAEWRVAGVACLSGVFFQCVMAVAICANSIVIGFETDNPEWPHWDFIENIFLVIFTVELLFRFCMYGPQRYFSLRDTDFLWNMLDMVIVILGLLDVSCALLVPSMNAGGGVATLFRTIRVLRILRILKIVRFLKQLYMLAVGFFEAGQAVCWVTMLMGILLYVCSIVLVRSMKHLEDDDPNRVFFTDRFASILLSMFTLFDVMTSPDFMEYHHVLGDHCAFGVFLVFFIIFGSFGMLALLTGVISESMFEKNQVKIEEERVERESKRKLIGLRCSELFDEAKVNADGDAEKEEIFSMVPYIAQMLENHSVPYASHEIEHVIELMDQENIDGLISKKEFVDGIVSFAEGVRPVAIMELNHKMILTLAQADEVDARVRNQSSANHDWIAGCVERLLAGQRRLDDQLDALDVKISEVAPEDGGVP